MEKEDRADRELGGEMRFEVMLERPGIDTQVTELSGRCWERPLSYSGIIQADNDDDDDDPVGA